MICTKCKSDKPVGRFRVRNKLSLEGRDIWCRSCERLYWSERVGTVTMMRNLLVDTPFTGERDHRDIRTFYTSELDYLVAMRKRYACANCGTSASECSSCQRTRERIEELGGC